MASTKENSTRKATAAPSEDGSRKAECGPSRPRTLSAFGAWALGFGCIIGWGCFFMPGTSFLPNAGPMGTAIALFIGALVMGCIAANYRFMMQHHPVDGGAFVFAQKSFGHSHGFACGWFLLLAFTPLVAQNATSIALLSRNLMGSFAEFGFDYSLAGYQAYFGDVLLSLIVLGVFAFILIRSTRLGYIVQTILACCIAAFLIIVVGGIISSGSLSHEALQPLYSPSKDPAMGVLAVLAMVPWAFVGFDVISQTAGDFTFSVRKTGRVMAIAIVMGLLVYVTNTFIAAAFTPPQYDSWPAYIAELDDLSGIQAVPVFFAFCQLFGDTGRIILDVAVLGAVLSGIMGFGIAGSRVLVVMSEFGHLAPWLSERHPVYGTPRNAIIATFAAAAVFTLLGRSILSWIIDLSSVGAALAFFYASAATAKVAKRENHPVAAAFGVIGAALSVVFILLLVLPIPIVGSQLKIQSLVFLAGWIALGLNYYTPPYRKRARVDFSSVVAIDDPGESTPELPSQNVEAGRQGNLDAV